jgi:SnoaL-like domain
MGGRGGLRHFNANLVVTPTPEGAKGSVYLLLFNARNVPATIVETAIYEDTLVKTPEGWRFKKRVVWRDDDDITPFKPKPIPRFRRRGKTNNDDNRYELKFRFHLASMQLRRRAKRQNDRMKAQGKDPALPERGRVQPEVRSQHSWQPQRPK